MQDENLKHLFQRAKSVMLQSYSPYSKFKVGAALLCKDGKIFCGCNYESVAFGAGVCAERVALGAAITAGEHEFDTIVVCGIKFNNEQIYIDMLIADKITDLNY